MTAIVDRRKEKLLPDVALVAHCLDHRYRGVSLERNDRARALRAIPSVAAMFSTAAPPLDEVLDFIAERGIYSDVGQLDCHPYNVWETVLGTLDLGFFSIIFFHFNNLNPEADSPLSDFGCRLASLPSTQASVERIFSACTWTTDGNREKLSFPHLVRDTKIRFNYNALQRKK